VTLFVNTFPALFFFAALDGEEGIALSCLFPRSESFSFPKREKNLLKERLPPERKKRLLPGVAPSELFQAL